MSITEPSFGACAKRVEVLNSNTVAARKQRNPFDMIPPPEQRRRLRRSGSGFGAFWEWVDMATSFQQDARRAHIGLKEGSQY
jgi:hypothetical protein